ncbi:hypothetical protein E2C01_057186 [Portunus trituberculatus]|uniref:Peptidase A2 domain-containing protein n=1 Tax=Portunus trituberculatus TaxID=210409 RepID=A0A5B7GW49_PORTR|nr:hypothetical protein [Portunus trituberculatus]
MAKKLRLITGQEVTTTQEIDLWLGPKKLEVVQLESVTIELGGGVVVVTPATVFPEWLEPHYDAEDVVLDAHQLRRGKMVQVFRPDGSDLIVRKPAHLLRRVCKNQRSMEPDVLKVKLLRRGKSKAMTLLMDTGAVGMYVSNKRSRLLTKAYKTRWLPKRVALHIGDSCCLRAEPLEEVASNDDDFISGIGLLGKYNAVLDYARHTVTFQVSSQWRKVVMQTRQQDLSTESERR